MKIPTAVITGATGQDGYYLTKFLLEKGYKVIAVCRRTSTPNTSRLLNSPLRNNAGLFIVNGDVTDAANMATICRQHQPDEWYHLAAQSHVGISWESPITTAEITGVGTLNCLEAIRKEKPDCKFYFAGSSEQFGNASTNGLPLDENSPMTPESPYAASKIFGYNITQVYRKSYKMFASCGILFNHESPLRGEEFVTRHITKNLANIALKKQNFCLSLGNTNSYRDWGFAGDYVEGMWLILQHSMPDDFVLATGETHSVDEFVDIALEYFNLDRSCVYIDPARFRPNDVNFLLGDYSKAKKLLNWTPKCSFDDLVYKMCKADYTGNYYE